MRSNIVAHLDTPSRHLGNLIDSLYDCVQGKFEIVLVEETEQSPEAGAAAILIFRLHIVVSFILARRPPWYLHEVRFGYVIAIEHRALASPIGVRD